ISFRTEHDLVNTSMGLIDAYFIRFKLKDGEYDTLPMINDLEFSVMPVTQRDTKAEYYDFPVNESGKYKLFTQLAATGDSRAFLKGSDGLFKPVTTLAKEVDPETGVTTFTISPDDDTQCVRIVNLMNDFYLDSSVGYGSGLPFQEYDLETKLLEYESFTIMTELPDSGGKYAEWTKTDDFSLANAEDFVYILDTNEGKIRFGDCIRGMAPEGKIFIIGCSMTLSSEGNVTRGKINRRGDNDTQELEISNFKGSQGGTDEETLEECCVRAHKLLETTETLVTNKDCEKFISSIQGLKIEKCQVIAPPKNADRSSGMVTSVVVKPYSASGMGIPNERYIKNIMKAVEPHRLLGTQLRIVRPEYTAVSVYADITVLKDHSDAQTTVENTIRDYFRALKDNFGVKIIYSKLYELIDTLECVVSVNTLTLETNGSGSQRTREGNIVLFPNVSAYLADVETMLTAVY
ncbi:MAG: baseplate J/gp47 family protein, partial [Ruminiclostridium sp.]|nr:baseplate J/gp47 family protein [Ruminiclostridium sp.]